jgi:hypothetical protein
MVNVSADYPRWLCWPPAWAVGRRIATGGSQSHAVIGRDAQGHSVTTGGARHGSLDTRRAGNVRRVE